jgi:hypothetical protein
MDASTAAAGFNGENICTSASESPTDHGSAPGQRGHGRQVSRVHFLHCRALARGDPCPEMSR